MVIANNAGPAQVLLDQVGQERHRLGLRLVEGDLERDVLGAEVAVARRGGPPLWARSRAAGSYLSHRGVLYQDQGRFDEAADALAAALELREEAATARRLGGVARARGHIAEARALYERTLRLEPQNPDLRVHVAAFALRRGRIEEAREHLRRAHRLRPEHPGTALQAASALAVLGDHRGRFGTWKRPSTWSRIRRSSREPGR